MDIEIIAPTFDLQGYYAYQLRLALYNSKLTNEQKLTKLKTLIQKAYEQGVMDAKNDQHYFENF